MRELRLVLAVFAVVQEFFDTMTAADSAGAQAVMLPEGVSFGVREQADGLFLRSRSNSDYIAGLAGREERVVERMWDPTVLLHERLAVVWTPYDIYVDGEFLHCGRRRVHAARDRGGMEDRDRRVHDGADRLRAEPAGAARGARRMNGVPP